MSEHLLAQLFAYMIDSSVSSRLRELSANLVARLAHSTVRCGGPADQHATCFIRLPYFHSSAGAQQQDNPIDFLLQTFTAPRKWKINLNGDETTTTTTTTTDETMSGIDGNTANIQDGRGLVYKESCHKVYCLRVPILKTTAVNQQVQANSAASQAPIAAYEIVRHSYSLAFMLRLDDNLIKFSKAYGINSI